MTLTTAQSLKDTWISIFNRKGGNGAYTRTFEDLEASQKNILLSYIALFESEIPVIGSIQDTKNWFILTTDRVVWSVGGECRELPDHTVCDAIIDLKQLKDCTSKLKMSQLQVVTISGEKYVIELEAGAPLSGVWNILKNLGARNRNANVELR